MIYDLAKLKGMPNIVENLETTESIGHIQIKETIELLSKIQIGDLLQGEWVVEDNQSLLKLENGLKLLTHLSVDVLLNKKLDFKVVGKEGERLLLECISSEAKTKNAASIIDQTLQKLNLSDTPEMRQMIQLFVEKQLPLIKDQLMRLVYFSKSYSMPTQVLTNLVSQNQVPQEGELKTLANLKEEGMKALLPTRDAFIENLESSQAREFAKSLFNLLNPHEVKQVLQKVDSALYEAEVQKEFLQLKQRVDNELNLTGVHGIRKQDVISPLLDQVLRLISPSQLQNLNKTLMDTCLLVYIDQISQKQEGEMEKITVLDTRLKEIAKVMKEVTLEKDEHIHLVTLEKNIEVLDKYKMQGHYFYFPLQIKEHQVSGELYFFKPKKHKMGQKSGICIVLALNMPTLHKIEIHLLEKSHEVTLKIKVENETIKEQLEQYKSVLLEMMDAEPILLKEVEIEILNEKHPKVETLTNELHSLDLKV